MVCTCGKSIISKRLFFLLTSFDVIEWMRPSDLDKAKELTSLFDAYIKDKL